MKLYNILLTASALVVAAGSVVSCSNKEDDIFDEAAAVRMDAAKTDTKALLVGAPNGWELSYFADNDWESGYVILMKFHNDESVEMAGSNAWVANAFMSADRDAVQRETSLYKMISDDGPVLTFDTFNKMLHIFSEPYNLPSPTYNPDNVPFPEGPQEKSSVSGKDYDVNEAGYGHNGDYEFVVLSTSENEIILRGKKTRLNMRMRRLAADADWDTYFSQINNRAANTFSTRFGELKMVVDGHELHLSNLTKGVMHIVADDDDPLMETVKIPFLYTPDGIRLREPYKGFEDRLADIAVQNFVFNPDGTISCIDKSVEFALNSSLPEIYLMQNFSWRLDLNSATGKVADLIAGIQAEAEKNSRFKALEYLRFEYDAKTKKYVVKIKATGNGTIGTLYGSPSVNEDGMLNLVYSASDGDNGGKGFVRTFPSLKTLLEFLSANSWSLSTSRPMGPDVLVMKNVANPDDSFTVYMN